MERLAIRTQRREQLVDVTDLIAERLGALDMDEGAVLAHVPHTTAGIIVNEGYDPAVAEDVLATLERLIPRDAGYRHAEGNSDAHVKAIATGGAQLLPVSGGRLMLGRWQRVFFCEFDGPRSREIWLLRT